MGTINIINHREGLLADRMQAAEMLNAQLDDYIEMDHLVVLGIPRGGVILADKIARHFNAELDIVLSRKMRALHNPELAVGAVSEEGNLYVNKPIVTALGLLDDYIEQEKALQLNAIQQRKVRYRQVLEKVPLRDKVVILTDDGVATGATMQAAIWATRTESPQKLILALPVAPRDTLKRLARDVDGTICLCAPSNFRAISQFYTYFEQVNDAQVVNILKDYAKIRTHG
jgi:putative phosphoribosyl transferase